MLDQQGLLAAVVVDPLQQGLRVAVEVLGQHHLDVVARIGVIVTTSQLLIQFVGLVVEAFDAVGVAGGQLPQPGNAAPPLHIGVNLALTLDFLLIDERDASLVVNLIAVERLHQPVHFGEIAGQRLVAWGAFPVGHLDGLVDDELGRGVEFKGGVSNLCCALGHLVVALHGAELTDVAQLHEVGEIAVAVVDAHQLGSRVAILDGKDQHGVPSGHCFGRLDVIAALDLDIIHALDHGQQRDYLFVIEHCRLPLLVAVILISDCLQPAHIHTKFLEEAQVGFNRCGIGCCRLLGCIAV